MPQETFGESQVLGNSDEQRVFNDVIRHYTMAKQDLQQRFIQFDKADILFRSYIVETAWPYRATVFDPRTFTFLYEKAARTFANKPQGRLVPRESGDSLGAKINNSLLDFQWDDNERVDGMPMLAKWAMMDLNARKYGSSFGLCKWHYEKHVKGDHQETKMMAIGQPTENTQKGKSTVFYDGPNFRPLNNRDCLPNPSYSTVKNWFDYREYVTFQDLANVNDTARTKPIYKNLDLLKQALVKQSLGGGDTRARNYTMKNLSIKGLTDYLGRDPVYKTIELITEYRPERWITFSPLHGVVVRDIPNPYNHGQIPICMLRYYPIDEDIYGLSEIEPIEKIQKAINALICQYLDAINMSLYTPIKVRSTGGAVQMHTLEFGPGKKWMMNDPATDVIQMPMNNGGIGTFTETYRFLVGAMQEALGESSQGMSGLVPGAGDKTATEIKDTALSRTARDNFNNIFLAEAMKKQMMFWHTMNQQFMFNSSEQTKLLRIVGKDALRYFQDVGLDKNGLTQEAMDQLQQTQDMGHTVDPHLLETPLYPVKTKDGIVNKLQLDEGGQSAKLHLEPEDLEGDYDYVPDITSMGKQATDQEIQSLDQMIAMATGVDPKTGQPTGLNAMLQKQGYQVKAYDLIVDKLEDLGKRDADRYFEKIPQTPPPQAAGMQMGGTNGQTQIGPFGGGAGTAQAGGAGMGNVQQQGMVGSGPSLPNGQAQPVVPGPQQVHP
jgi:hypothetical protein